FRLLDHMTTYENFSLPPLELGMVEAGYRDEVGAVVRWLGRGERLMALLPGLSCEFLYHDAILRSVIAGPSSLLSQQPTGNVDPVLARRLVRLFAELNKSGTAVVIATHDIGLMDLFDARRLVLHEGRMHIYE